MRTIAVEIARYLNGGDQVALLIYRGTGWKLNTENKDKDSYPILEIYNQDEMISMHKSWDNVKFSDVVVSETIN